MKGSCTKETKRTYSVEGNGPQSRYWSTNVGKPFREVREVQGG
jgi:hypothetical protein